MAYRSGIKVSVRGDGGGRVMWERDVWFNQAKKDMWGIIIASVQLT